MLDIAQLQSNNQEFFNARATQEPFFPMMNIFINNNQVHNSAESGSLLDNLNIVCEDRKLSKSVLTSSPEMLPLAKTEPVSPELSPVHCDSKKSGIMSPPQGTKLSETHQTKQSKCGFDDSISPPSNGKVVTKRKVFSRTQLTILEQRFTEQSFLSQEERQQLAAQLSITERQVMIWFQNRRGRLKKRGSADPAYNPTKLNDLTMRRNYPFLASTPHTVSYNPQPQWHPAQPNNYQEQTPVNHPQWQEYPYTLGLQTPVDVQNIYPDQSMWNHSQGMSSDHLINPLAMMYPHRMTETIQNTSRSPIEMRLSPVSPASTNNSGQDSRYQKNTSPTSGNISQTSMPTSPDISGVALHHSSASNSPDLSQALQIDIPRHIPDPQNSGSSYRGCSYESGLLTTASSSTQGFPQPNFNQQQYQTQSTPGLDFGVYNYHNYQSKAASAIHRNTHTMNMPYSYGGINSYHGYPTHSYARPQFDHSMPHNVDIGTNTHQTPGSMPSYQSYEASPCMYSRENTQSWNL